MSIKGAAEITRFFGPQPPRPTPPPHHVLELRILPIRRTDEEQFFLRKFDIDMMLVSNEKPMANSLKSVISNIGKNLLAMISRNFNDIQLGG